VAARPRYGALNCCGARPCGGRARLMRRASAPWSARLLRCVSVRWPRSTAATRVHAVAALTCCGAQLRGHQFALGRSRACGSTSGHRADEHSMAQQTSYSAVPGQHDVARHGYGTMPNSAVPGRAVQPGWPCIPIDNDFQSSKQKKDGPSPNSTPLSSLTRYIHIVHMSGKYIHFWHTSQRAHRSSILVWTNQ